MKDPDLVLFCTISSGCLLVDFDTIIAHRVNFPSLDGSDPVIVRAADVGSDQAARLTHQAGVYALVPQTGEAHFGWSKDLGRRVHRLFRTFRQGNPDAHGPGFLKEIQCWPVYSELERLLRLYSLTKQFFPGDYLRRMRLQRPWFVGLTDESNWARLHATQRFVAKTVQIGPFRGRDAAQHFEESVSALFRIRRCSEVLKPSPDHPGCLYGDIGQCLKPCQASADPGIYAAETRRVSEILSLGADRLLSEVELARAKASDELNFERARELHRLVEKVQLVRSLRRQGVGVVKDFGGIAITPSAQPQTVRLWPLRAGLWQEPIDVNTSSGDGAARAAAQTLRERWDHMEAPPPSYDLQGEHLAILLRWLRSSFRSEAWLPLPSSERLQTGKFTRALNLCIRRVQGA